MKKRDLPYSEQSLKLAGKLLKGTDLESDRANADSLARDIQEAVDDWFDVKEMERDRARKDNRQAP